MVNRQARNFDDKVMQRALIMIELQSKSCKKVKFGVTKKVENGKPPFIRAEGDRSEIGKTLNLKFK